MSDARELPMEAFSVSHCEKLDAREHNANGRYFYQSRASIRSNEEITMMETRDCALGGRWSVVFTGSANALTSIPQRVCERGTCPASSALICDESGPLLSHPGRSRVIVGRFLQLWPARNREIERRGYRDWDDGPAGGWLRAPGVQCQASASATIAGNA